MIVLYLENLKKMKNLKINNYEKTFRDLGSGFVYYIVIGTSVYKKRSRTTKMKKLSSKEKIRQVRMLKENLKKMKKRKDRKEKNEKEKNEEN